MKRICDCLDKARSCLNNGTRYCLKISCFAPVLYSWNRYLLWHNALAGKPAVLSLAIRWTGDAFVCLVHLVNYFIICAWQINYCIRVHLASEGFTGVPLHQKVENHCINTFRMTACLVVRSDLNFGTVKPPTEKRPLDHAYLFDMLNYLSANFFGITLTQILAPPVLCPSRLRATIFE